MFDIFFSFATGNPVAMFALLAIIGILLWLFGYSVGNKDGHIDQHTQEMRFLSSSEKVEFEVASEDGGLWMVTSIMQRRGNRRV